MEMIICATARSKHDFFQAITLKKRCHLLGDILLFVINKRYLFLIKCVIKSFSSFLMIVTYLYYKDKKIFRLQTNSRLSFVKPFP